MLIVVAAGLLGGLAAAGLVSDVVALPLELAVQALLGVAGQLVVAAVPGNWQRAGEISDVALAVLPALALVGCAVLARAGRLLRQISAVVAVALSVAAYSWMPAGHATLAVAVVGLVAVAVSLGSKLLVSVPLAVLSGALVVHTAGLILAGAPAVGRAAVELAAPGDAVWLMVAKWALLVAGTGVAAGQWRKAL